MSGHLLGGDVRGNGDLFGPGRDLKQTGREGGPGRREGRPGASVPSSARPRQGRWTPPSSPPRGTPRPPATRSETSSPPGLRGTARSARRPRSRRPAPPRRPPSPSPTPAPAPTLAQQQDADVPLHGSRPEPGTQLQPEPFPSPRPTLPAPSPHFRPRPHGRTSEPDGPERPGARQCHRVGASGIAARRRPGGGATAGGGGALSASSFPAGPGPAHSGQDRPCRWAGQGLGCGQRLLSGQAGEPGPGQQEPGVTSRQCDNATPTFISTVQVETQKSTRVPTGTLLYACLGS